MRWVKVKMAMEGFPKAIQYCSNAKELDHNCNAQTTIQEEKEKPIKNYYAIMGVTKNATT
jgi:hypothetical protein